MTRRGFLAACLWSAATLAALGCEAAAGRLREWAAACYGSAAYGDPYEKEC